MEFLSSSGGPFDGLTSFIGRSFSRRSKKPRQWQPHAPVFAEYAPARVIAECALTHRALAMELTASVIDHYLDLTRKLAEVKRQIDLQKREAEHSGAQRRSHIAEDESQAWERWLGVIETAIRSAEAEVVAVVQAWEASRTRKDDPTSAERGVIHKGRLYLAVPGDTVGELKLSIVDLQSALNLDGSMAVIDVVTPDRLGGPARAFPLR